MLESCKGNKIVESGMDYGPAEDYHLRFFPPDELELIRNAQNFGVEYQDYRPQTEFSYL